MTLRSSLLSLLALTTLALAACDDGSTAPDQPGDDAAAGKADAIAPACDVDEDCGDAEVCEPGFCYHWCSVDDPNCCAPSACVPMEPEPEPEPECSSDADCGEGQWCQPGLCFFWCSVDDPDCCEPSSCEPIADQSAW